MIKRADAVLIFALLAALGAASFAGGAAAAADRVCKGGVFSVYLENDLFHRTDRNYTSGVKLAWVSPDLKKFEDAKCMPGWLEAAEKAVRDGFALKFAEEADKRNFVATIGQEMYTPGDGTRKDLIRSDRPYAGWLYLGLGYNERRGERTASTGRLDSFELKLGMVGPASLARHAQHLLHDLRSFPRFQGWDNQLHNEPGLQAIWEHKLKRKIGNTNRADLIGHVGASVGNVATYLNAGVELRLGADVPEDFGSSPLRPAGNNTSPGAWSAASGKEWHAHFFAALDARVVARDIFLDGNTFVHSHRVHKRPLVADLAMGVAGFAYGWKFSVARVFRSTEFDGQGSRHSYGSFTVSYAFE